MKKAIAIMLSVLVLFAVVPAGALQASALENGDVQLTLNVPYAAEIGGNETKSFFFTPESDGTYIFSSQSELDTRASLNSDQDYLAYDDDDGEDFNFLIEYFLTAGVTYRLDVDLLGGGNGGSVRNRDGLYRHRSDLGACRRTGKRFGFRRQLYVL